MKVQSTPYPHNETFGNYDELEYVSPLIFNLRIFTTIYLKVLF